MARIASTSASTVDVAVIGAGSAGLAAARTLRRAGRDVALIEASHRIGGRALTETFGGFGFDLGCHWMHSASLNPYVAIADSHGLAYTKQTWPRRTHFGDRWAEADEERARIAFADRSYGTLRDVARAGRDMSIADATEREDRWTPVFDFWISIMCSGDSDLVSVVDTMRYRDTGENWPLVEGYGALVERHFAKEPVQFNARAERIDWGGGDVRIETPRGTITARKAIVTVSTGVLAAGDIRFDPVLPDWKLAAIAGLPLGSHNRIGLMFDRDVFGSGRAGPDERGTVTVYAESPETIAFQIRPFGHNMAVGIVGGRFSAWLERAGPAAMVDYAMEKLAAIYGADIAKHLTATRCSAWDGDPLIRGAYSHALPGHAERRADLARPIDDRLFFAGEATSPDFFSTCHGAYLSGVTAAEAVEASLG